MKKTAKFTIEIEYEDLDLSRRPTEGSVEKEYRKDSMKIINFEQEGEVEGLSLALFLGLFAYIGNKSDGDLKQLLKNKIRVIRALLNAILSAWNRVASEEAQSVLDYETLRLALKSFTELLVSSTVENAGFSDELIDEVNQEDYGKYKQSETNEEQGHSESDFDFL